MKEPDIDDPCLPNWTEEQLKAQRWRDASMLVALLSLPLVVSVFMLCEWL